MFPLKYLAGYAEETKAQVRSLIDQGRLHETLARRYGAAHEVRTDRALYDYTMALKSRFMRSADPLAKVVFDQKLKVLQHALGTHTTISRVQGGQLKAKREIRVASLFKDTPPEFLKMIVVHELAHLRVRSHGPEFWAALGLLAPGFEESRNWLATNDTQLNASFLDG